MDQENPAQRSPSAKQDKDENLIFDYSDEPKQKPSAPMAQPTKRSTDKTLIISIAVLLLAIALFGGVIYWKNNQVPLTIEDLHQQNLQGKLDEDVGFVYKGVYSFVKVNDFWSTALVSQQGGTQYNFAFRYSPRELEHVPLRGTLDAERFNNATDYYITFNPLADNLSYTVLAVNDFNQHMLNTFQKTPIAACDRNETAACFSRPIVNCHTAHASAEIVVYIQQAPAPSVEINGTCIMLKGSGFDQVKSVDRLLYTFYNIME